MLFYSSTGEIYDAERYRKIDVIPVEREITIEQATIIPQTQGHGMRSHKKDDNLAI